MDDSQKIIEELKTEIVSLKIRLARVERFIQDSPDPKEYILPETDDSLLEEAKIIVGQYDRASASLLQRKLSIGYARAARLLNQLEEARVVGPGKGSEPREVLIKNEQK